MKFKKEILTEGVYLVSTENGRQKKKITKEDLQHLAKTHDKMRQNGLNIPAPLAHAENEIPTKVKQEIDVYQVMGSNILANQRAFQEAKKRGFK